MKPKPQDYRQQNQHKEIDAIVARHRQTGLCVSGCGKKSRAGVTCGDLVCVRKWLRIGILCPNCRRHFYHDSVDGFCSIKCKNEQFHRINAIKEI